MRVSTLRFVIMAAAAMACEMGTPGEKGDGFIVGLFGSCAQPVFHMQTRNLLKIAQVARQQHCVMHQGYGGNLEIHGPNAHPLAPEGLKRIGSVLIKP